MIMLNFQTSSLESGVLNGTNMRHLTMHQMLNSSDMLFYNQIIVIENPIHWITELISYRFIG